jgi:hypothetical protein
VGENVHRCVERRLRWLGALALLEHSLPHDVGADALRGFPKHVIYSAGLAPGTLSQCSMVIPSGAM